jgi:hypothetical protein
MKKLRSYVYKGLVPACLVAFVMCGGAFAQYKGSPVKKEKLLTVLRSRQLQTREIVNVIKTNGVDFRLSKDDELELYTAGARPEVIAAAKANYRAATAVAAKGGNTKFTGQPLAKDAIVTLLQNGVTDLKVRNNVSARGVNFKPTAADTAEIKKTGGSVALINLITASYVDPNQNTAANNDANTTTGGTDKYNNLVDQAVTQYDGSKDTTGAIATLQQAVVADPNEARAYQQMGYMYLYGQKNFAEAEKNMREAVNRGGSAVFRVFHGHDAFMTEACQGSLFIAKDTVRFESDDNKHTFETTDTNIKEVKMNSFFKSIIKSRKGTFKFALKSGETESVNFTFAPLTDNALESKMIIRLIGK